MSKDEKVETYIPGSTGLILSNIKIHLIASVIVEEWSAANNKFMFSMHVAYLAQNGVLLTTVLIEWTKADLLSKLNTLVNELVKRGNLNYDVLELEGGTFDVGANACEKLS